MLKQACIDYGKEEGNKEGRTEAKLEAARNMLLENDSIEKVARCLNLSLKKVRELAEELKIKD